MSRSHDSRRYCLAKQGSKHFLVSPSSKKILQALMEHKNCGYEELQASTKLPQDSLYVFCQRLQQAGLLSRTKVKPKNGETRTRTAIKLKGGKILFPTIKVTG